jgi:DNA polymerase-4
MCNMSERRIAHMDMDAFYVSVELGRRPELRGLPVVVSGSGPRAVVTTASYEARKFGVGSAMPASRARRLCPQAIFIPPDFTAYREASAAVMGVVRRHVETIEIIGLDEAYLDLTGLPAPRACMKRIVLEIKAETGLTASVGIGPNKLVAKVASDAEKPHGFVMLTREEACQRFGDSPCRLIPGIGGKTAERLQTLGLHRIAQLREAPYDLVRSAFSANTASHLQSLARFEHAGAVTQERKVVSESRERTFDEDVTDTLELEAILRRQADELCAALLRQDRRGRTIAIKVRLDDFTTHTRARTLASPVNSPDDVGRIALELLRDFAPPRPVRLLGVRVAGLSVGSEEPQQLALAV